MKVIRREVTKPLELLPIGAVFINCDDCGDVCLRIDEVTDECGECFNCWNFNENRLEYWPKSTKSISCPMATLDANPVE